MMPPNEIAVLTPEEIATDKRTMAAANPAPWHYAGSCVRNEDDQDICCIEETFSWNPGCGVRPTADVVADATAIATARTNYPRALATIEALQAKCEALEKSQERQGDLLRYCRQKLHDEELISDEEYMTLLTIPGAVARLNGYDELRQQLAALEKERDGLKSALESVVPYIQKRADEFYEFARNNRYPDERYYRCAGSGTSMHNLANEIGSFIVNPANTLEAACQK